MFSICLFVLPGITRFILAGDPIQRIYKSLRERYENP